MPNLIVLPGDGVGPEVIRQAVRIVEWFARHRGFDCNIRHEDFGAENYYRTGHFLREDVLDDMKTADAVLFGALGGSIDDRPIPADIRRKEGLLRIRKEMDTYANLRPVKIFPSLADASPLRRDVIEGVDLVVVRELVGGIYFGEPRGIEALSDGQRRGFNTLAYTTNEIDRIARVAFDVARTRRNRVTSVDKHNVLETSVLWREVVTALHRDEYPDVELFHLYVDNAAMQLIRNPRQFDVMLTDNMFGDILSDAASMISASLGMLPSASLSAPDAEGRRRAFYEPVHGSAPDIAGRDQANPIAAILTVGMALGSSFGRQADAKLLDRAVDAALVDNRTRDIAEPGKAIVSTSGMGDAVLAALDRLSR